MPISAKSLVQRAIDISQDIASTRWPVAEMVRWLNDGQREILLHRPDVFSKAAVLPCVAGTRQTLPAGGAKLIDVLRNAGGAMRAVRECSRELLEAQVPGWHGATPRDEVMHFMFDPREPRAFWVYPPATAAAQLDIRYAAAPVDIADPAGNDAGAVAGDIGVPDLLANALLDYLLHRVYLKDAEFAGSAGRAQAHYAAFAQALGIEVRATIVVGPASRGNPNARAAAAQAAVAAGGGV